MMTDVSSVRIWLHQLNSESNRLAPTLWSIFSFIDVVDGRCHQKWHNRKNKVQESCNDQLHACELPATRYQVGPTQHQHNNQCKKTKLKKDEFLVPGTWYSTRYIGPITWYQVPYPVSYQVATMMTKWLPCPCGAVLKAAAPKIFFWHTYDPHMIPGTRYTYCRPYLEYDIVSNNYYAGHLSTV